MRPRKGRRNGPIKEDVHFAKRKTTEVPKRKSTDPPVPLGNNVLALVNTLLFYLSIFYLSSLLSFYHLRNERYLIYFWFLPDVAFFWYINQIINRLNGLNKINPSENWIWDKKEQMNILYSPFQFIFFFSQIKYNLLIGSWWYLVRRGEERGKRRERR